MTDSTTSKREILDVIFPYEDGGMDALLGVIDSDLITHSVRWGDDQIIFIVEGPAPSEPETLGREAMIEALIMYGWAEDADEANATLDSNE